MATHKQLEDEWKHSLNDDYYLWTEEDLQLAAELGKTLLERNKELENALRQSQNVIDDQTQEIMYLNKQTTALREVNESRLKIYEQLEISVNDLEIVKHKLGVDYANEKKRTKNLTGMLELLETKNNEQQSEIDDLTMQIDLLKKKLGRKSEYCSTPLASPTGNKYFGSQPASPEKPEPSPKKTQQEEEEEALASVALADALDEVAKLLDQLREVKLLHTKEQRRVTELEESLEILRQQNRALQDQIFNLHHNEEEFKSIHEEISLLEEVRKGQICSRCLTDLEYIERQCRTGPDGYEEEEPLDDDDSSILNEIMNATPPYIAKFEMDVDDYKDTQTPNTPMITKNFYKELVEKYEPLFGDHAQKSSPKKMFVTLEEELKNSGEFSSFGLKDQDYESGHDDCSSDKQNDSKKSRKNVSRTPTDFSEAETSSSGFADEMSNSSKSTQTDCILGSLLCSISAGEDCSLGVYNIADSQAQQKSRYLELFKDIFKVLKKASESHDEVYEASRHLDIKETSMSTSCQTPLSISTAEVHCDDDESLKSSTISLTVALPQGEVAVQSVEKKEPEEAKATQKKTKGNKKAKHQKKEIAQNTETPETKEETVETKIEVPSSSAPIDIPAATGVPKPEELVLRPLIRESYDYIHVEHRKRSSSRRKNRNADRSDSPMTLIGSQPINYTSRPNSGRRRRELKNAQRKAETPELPNEMNWNGNTLQFWSSNRANVSSPTPSQCSEKAFYEFKPSVASQEIRRLKSLDKSYAEVLKLGENRKRENQQRRRASKGTTQHR